MRRGCHRRTCSTRSQTSNAILPGGTAKFGNYEFLVTLNGSPIHVEEFNKIPIKYQNGATVFVGDVAPGSDSYAVQTDIARVNGIAGDISLRPEARVGIHARVVDDVKGVIPRINALAPKGTKIYLAFDQSAVRQGFADRRLSGNSYRFGAGRDHDDRVPRLVAEHPHRDHVDSARDYDARSSRCM